MGLPAYLSGGDTGDHVPPVAQHLVDSTPLLEEMSQRTVHNATGPGFVTNPRVSSAHFSLGCVLALQRHRVGGFLPVTQEEHDYALLSEAGGLEDVGNIFIIVNARVAVLIRFWGRSQRFGLFVRLCGLELRGRTQHDGLLGLIRQRRVLRLKIRLQSPYGHSELVDFILYTLPASPGGVLPVRRLREHGDQLGVGHLAVGLVGQVGHEQRHALDDARDATAPHGQRNLTREVSELRVDGDVHDRRRQDVPELLGQTGQLQLVALTVPLHGDVGNLLLQIDEVILGQQLTGGPQDGIVGLGVPPADFGISVPIFL